MQRYRVDLILDADLSKDCVFSVDELRAWLPCCLQAVEQVGGSPGSLGVRLASEQTVAALNGQFRGKPQPTDVLSFPGELTPEGRHLGDIVVSVPTAASQALAEGHTLDQELRVLVLHGVLHCLGFDHETDDGEMDENELRLREILVPGSM